MGGIKFGAFAHGASQRRGRSGPACYDKGGKCLPRRTLICAGYLTPNIWGEIKYDMILRSKPLKKKLPTSGLDEGSSAARHEESC